MLKPLFLSFGLLLPNWALAQDCVILLHGLAPRWLNEADRRKIDGFRNRFLRAVWGIKPFHVLQISSKSMLEKLHDLHTAPMKQ